MHRLFVAIEPPAHVRDQLLDLMGGVPGARWQRDDQLHLTLRFVGEVDRHAANDVAAAMGGLHHPRVDISLSGVGAFDKRDRPTALWAGVAPQEPLRTLHNKVDQALSRVGLAPEGQAYRPHITLARFGREAGALGGFLAANAGLSSAPFAVADICLYESNLTNDGPVYTIVARYPLG